MLAAIALGTNLPSRFGELDATLQEAIRRLGSLGTVTAVSRFHTTEPEEFLAQPRFLNATALLRTTLAPHALLLEMLAIEQAMGRDRTRTQAKGPRVLDLDLLLCREDDGRAMVVREGDELCVPHPAMHRRGFVLVPLAEIAADWVHPGTQATVAEMLTGVGSAAG